MSKLFRVLVVIVVLINAFFIWFRTVEKVNDKIDPSLRSQIAKLNELALEAIMEGDYVKLKKIHYQTNEQRKDHQTWSKLLEEGPKAFTEKSIKAFDDYYLEHPKMDVQYELTKNKEQPDGYSLFFTTYARKMYISLFTVPGKLGDKMVLAFYKMDGSQWKLTWFGWGNYAFAGKNAQDFYKLSKEQMAREELLDAAGNGTIIQQIYHPVGDFFFYNNEEEMLNHSKSTAYAAGNKYRFPIVVENLQTKPKIGMFMSSPKPDGVFLAFAYVTTLDIQDDAALQAESLEIAKELPVLFPGIEKNNSKVILVAHDKTPGPKDVIKKEFLVDIPH